MDLMASEVKWNENPLHLYYL